MRNVVDLFGTPVEEDAAELEFPGAKTNWACAEFFACGVLSELGFIVHHTPSVGYDLLLESLGQVLRVQVKGASGRKDVYCFLSQIESWNARQEKGLQRIRRPLDRRDADLLAYVCLDLRKVIFKVVPKVWNGSHRVPRAHFEIPGIEAESLKQAMQDLST